MRTARVADPTLDSITEKIRSGFDLIISTYNCFTPNTKLKKKSLYLNITLHEENRSRDFSSNSGSNKSKSIVDPDPQPLKQNIL